MDIRKLDRESLCAEYGALTQRLMPWAAVNAPFEGAWCVLGPGGASDPHSHHEYEIFIAVSGTGSIDSDGKRGAFNAGDVAFLPPGSFHQVINEGEGEFQFYSVWWDAEMTQRFASRHEQTPALVPADGVPADGQ